MSDTLLRSVADGVATLTLNRPHRRNALDYELGSALLEALEDAAHDVDVRAVVVVGTGTAFCAGDDVGTVAQFQDRLGADDADTPSCRKTGDSLYRRICEAIIRLRKPVVAGVNGVAVGAGLEIACAADYRLAGEQCRMGSCLVRVGQVGNAAMLPRVVGVARATEIYLTGRMVDAPEALRIGLVDRVVPQEHFDGELAALAATLGRGPTAAIGLFKELRERALGQPPEVALRLQDVYHLRTHRETSDGAEGIRAFLEGRAARFEGR